MQEGADHLDQIDVMQRPSFTRIASALATALALLVGGVPVQKLRAQGDDGARYVRVDGAALRVITSGSGAPAVVFEAGLGEDASTWKTVQPVAAQRSATFSYDRAGLGQSAPLAPRRDAHRLAWELRQALLAADVRAPYVLVGHSLGAWIVQAFAQRYPRDVAGLVLVDPAFRESALRAALSPSQWKARDSALAAYGPPPAAIQRERDALERSGVQAERARLPAGVPAVLISATRINASFPGAEEELRVKLAAHRAWLSRSRGAIHLTTDRSRHYVQRDAPEIVTAALDSIRARIASGR